MKKWQQDITEAIAAGTEPRGILNRILPGRRRFAQDTARMVELFAYSSPKIKPDAAVKSRLMARLDGAPETRDSFIIAEADRKWTTIFPGVKECELARGDGRLSRLLRIKKGFILPPHKHREIEEAFIIEGRCYSGKMLLQQGDYFFAHADTRHATVKAVEDCVILLVAHQ